MHHQNTMQLLKSNMHFIIDHYYLLLFFTVLTLQFKTLSIEILSLSLIRFFFTKHHTKKSTGSSGKTSEICKRPSPRIGVMNFIK